MQLIFGPEISRISCLRVSGTSPEWYGIKHFKNILFGVESVGSCCDVWIVKDMSLVPVIER